MSERKMALPPLKISEPYRLVWGLLCLTAGIILFASYPNLWLAIFAGFVLVLVGVIYRYAGFFYRQKDWGLAGLAISFVVAGILCSAFQYYSHSHPVLSKVETVRIQAVIEDLSYRPTGRLRLHLRHLDKDETIFAPLQEIRVTIAPDHPFQAGDRIDAEMVLFPLSLPAFAGRPDYARQQYFSGLSDTGYITSIYNHQPAFEATVSQRLINWRRAFAHELNQMMPPPLGAIAAALLVGVRDFIPASDYDSFRSSGLAHLLAISGLHMGLFCFSVYGFVRFGGAFFPSLSQRYAVHKGAAIAALIAGGIYLCLSGFPVSAIRAYLMACIVILAVLKDRRALTLRNLALVGCVMLALQPSLVYSAGFQLSFLASFAIIYALFLNRELQIKNRYLRWLAFMVISSSLAGLITMPVIAYHSAHFTIWGVVANIIAIPLTGLLILPTGIIVLIAAAIGAMPVLELATWLMAQPLGWLVAFNRLMAGLPWAGSHISPPPQFLLFIGASASVMLATLSGIWRGAGALLAVITIGLWGLTPVPDAALLGAGREQVLVVRDDGGKLTATARLSDFWQSHIHNVMGNRAGEIATCTAPDFCALALPGGGRLAFVRKRQALGDVCRAGFTYIISAKRPYYPCSTGQPIYYRRLQHGERYLVYFTADPPKFVSNLPGLPSKWHPPPNIGE